MRLSSIAFGFAQPSAIALSVLFTNTNSQNDGKIVKIHFVKAFAQDKNQGNPVGIVFNADELSAPQMMSIVVQTGFSECAFIQKSDVADYKLRFYSPKKEMNLCAHATIATFHLIKKITGKTNFTQETLAGVLPVTCHNDGLIVMEQGIPVFYDKEYEIDFIAKILNINPSHIINEPIRVSTGTPKLLVELDSQETLWSLQPDFNAIQEHIPTGIYPFVFETESLYCARQFNPSTGINEDPVTGVAAGALGAYLKKYRNYDHPFVVEQGHMLGKIGKIFVDPTRGIKVGGYAVEFGEREIEIQ